MAGGRVDPSHALVRRRRAAALARDTGGECIEFLGRLHGSVDTSYRQEPLERFQLDPNRRVREYSKGNRQKIQLVAAFSTRAELLVLDEPTSGLDPLMEAAFRETVGEADCGQTVFLSSHILSEVEALCDRVGILRGGRLVEEGTLDELRDSASRGGGDVLRRRTAGQVPPGVTVEPLGERGVRFSVRAPSGP